MAIGGGGWGLDDILEAVWYIISKCSMLFYETDYDAEQWLRNQIMTFMYTVLLSKSPNGVGW